MPTPKNFKNRRKTSKLKPHGCRGTAVAARWSGLKCRRAVFHTRHPRHCDLYHRTAASGGRCVHALVADPARMRAAETPGPGGQILRMNRATLGVGSTPSWNPGTTAAWSATAWSAASRRRRSASYAPHRRVHQLQPSRASGARAELYWVAPTCSRAARRGGSSAFAPGRRRSSTGV